MNFKKFFKESSKQEEIIEKSSNTEDILEKIRKEVKIKQIIPTRFGIEVKLFNTKDAETAAKVAKTDKIDGSSIFID